MKNVGFSNPTMRAIWKTGLSVSASKVVALLMRWQSVLGLNGHTLTIRSLKHKNRKGWSGKVIDSSGGGSVVWKNHGLKIILD